MNPSLRRFLLPGFLLLTASPLFGQGNPPLATPHFELYQPDDLMKRPLGALGLPLGTFAVIEGTEHHTSKDWGSDDFVVESINGKKVARDLRIMTDLPQRSVPGKRYVLHGYEAGRWQGQPDGLPNNEPLGQTQQAGFSFRHFFTVTSVEKVDGVTVADARPLDPQVPRVEPKIADKPDNARPIGILGLPLGTFAIIQVHSPTLPPKMDDSFQIDMVNGKPLDKAQYISIPGVANAKDGERLILHGFEAGVWGSTPGLPRSEDPSKGPGPQQNFQFNPQFVVTSQVKAAG